MALLTPMSLAEARALAAAYGLVVDRVEPLAQGINSNFVLHLAAGGKAFARACEQCSGDQVRAQAALLGLLCDSAVPTPRPLERSDGAGAVTDHRGKPTLLFPFCAGRMLCQSSVRPEHTEQLGRALARMHAATAAVEYPCRGSFSVDDSCRQLDGLLTRPELAALGAELGELAERARSVASLPGAEPAADTIVHGDLFRDNVLWAGDRLGALLDFEFACRDSAAFDLMVTALAWCFGDDFQGDLVRALVAGYAAERPPTAAMVDALFPQAQRAALRFAVSRLEDYELKPRQSIRYKDFHRFVNRLTALERIGASDFPRWLGLA
ncbi:MAG: homoserine kinase [Deltaproteobacteria bacterium]|jgi:homoserine kinase type II|nr:homoserine kinase [Deltaproteobacteria bacterium]MBW2534128.1 homoserine kinase [Deltaproteobacteria bacterium]